MGFPCFFWGGVLWVSIEVGKCWKMLPSKYIYESTFHGRLAAFAKLHEKYCLDVWFWVIRPSKRHCGIVWVGHVPWLLYLNLGVHCWDEKIVIFHEGRKQKFEHYNHPTLPALKKWQLRKYFQFEAISHWRHACFNMFWLFVDLLSKVILTSPAKKKVLKKMEYYYFLKITWSILSWVLKMMIFFSTWANQCFFDELVCSNN